MTTQLTTLDNVEQWLGMTPGANANADSLLTRLITAACAWIEGPSCLSRTIGAATYSRRFSGLGANSQAMMLPEYPVISVSSVTIDGAAVPEAPDSQSNGYLFDDYQVYLIGYEFTRGRLNVSISWQAGYESVPSDIEQACIHLVAARFKEKERIDEKSKVIQGMNVTFSLTDMPAPVASALMGYKKVAPV